MFAVLVSVLVAGEDGGCVDTRDSCYIWSTVGECEGNPTFMHSTCPAACGLCQREAVAETRRVAVDAYGVEDSGRRMRGLHALSAPTASASIVLVAEEAYERIPLGLPAGDHIVAVEAGELHLVVLTAFGAVFTWGDGQLGQLGRPLGPSREPFTQRAPHRLQWRPPTDAGTPATAIGAGHMHSAAVLRGGDLVMWGDNSHSQCGIPYHETILDPIPTDLELLDAVSAAPFVVDLPVQAAAVSCGEVHTLVLSTEGDVYAASGHRTRPRPLPHA